MVQLSLPRPLLHSPSASYNRLTTKQRYLTGVHLQHKPTAIFLCPGSDAVWMLVLFAQGQRAHYVRHEQSSLFYSHSKHLSPAHTNNYRDLSFVHCWCAMWDGFALKSHNLCPVAIILSMQGKVICLIWLSCFPIMKLLTMNSRSI